MTSFAQSFYIPGDGQGNFKTRFCKFYRIGKCRYDNECTFIHEPTICVFGQNLESNSPLQYNASPRQRINSISTNVSQLSTINISQANDSSGYSSQKGLETMSSNTKDHFSKPFLPKSNLRKSVTLRSTNDSESPGTGAAAPLNSFSVSPNPQVGTIL